MQALRSDYTRKLNFGQGAGEKLKVHREKGKGKSCNNHL